MKLNIATRQRRHAQTRHGEICPGTRVPSKTMSMEIIKKITLVRAILGLAGHGTLRSETKTRKS